MAEPKKLNQSKFKDISAEDLAKVERLKASTDGAWPVDNEWLLLAEFGRAYGWQAYQAAKLDLIPIEEMLTLVEANRKLEAQKHYEMAQAVLIGSGSANSRKPSSTFKSLTSDILKRIKVKQ